MTRIRAELLKDLDRRGKIDWAESFVDGSFASAKRGGPLLAKPNRGKGTKWMAIVDGNGLPLGMSIHSASPAECTLVEETLR